MTDQKFPRLFHAFVPSYSNLAWLVVDPGLVHLAHHGFGKNLAVQVLGHDVALASRLRYRTNLTLSKPTTAHEAWRRIAWSA
jgi:hypothetical protein